MDDYPRITNVTTTRIDLRIIQDQLDVVENALMMSWRNYTFQRIPMIDHVKEIEEAMDNLLSVKKSLGLVSVLVPKQERLSAVTKQTTEEQA